MRAYKNCFFYWSGMYNEGGIYVQTSQKDFAIKKNHYSITRNGKGEIECVKEHDSTGKAVIYFYADKHCSHIQ